jgi:hypothetical protein
VSKPIVVLNKEQRSAIIVFTTTEPARTTLEFWHNEPIGKLTLPISADLKTSHQIQITNLTPGNSYRYKIQVVTAEHSFTTEEFIFEM